MCLIMRECCAVLSFPDVNECELATHGCSNSAECVNVPGTYSCVCSAGYQLSDDGTACQGTLMLCVCVCVNMTVY